MPHTIDSAPLHELLVADANKHKQENSKEEPENKPAFVMCNNPDEAITEDMLADANLEPGKMYVFNHSKQKFEKVRMLEDAELDKILTIEVPEEEKPSGILRARGGSSASSNGS